MDKSSLLNINGFTFVFFIGVAGTGMSAIAQYLSGIGKNVSGSDRYFKSGELNDTQSKLELAGVKCFFQDGTGITENTDLVVVSSAIEDTVPDLLKAKKMSITIVKRSELLAIIAANKKTIAIGGTSGKSTTSSMLFHILQNSGFDTSIINGAGLINIIKCGFIGNSHVGKGEWLIIEADESDGSIIQYHPEIGLLLNISKDHKEIEELIVIFNIFKLNTKNVFICNQSNKLTASLSADISNDFSTDNSIKAGFIAENFHQKGLKINFSIKNQLFEIKTVGEHNMENAVAAVAVAAQLGVDLMTSAKALINYEGLYRRHQLLGIKNGIYVVDDYAHNPVKCSASIKACQFIAPKVIGWFQPHGYGPTRFLKNDYIQEFIRTLRPEDELWMSEIFYAGGTATKNISANDMIVEIKAAGKNAFFVENRNDFLNAVRPNLSDNCVLLLMGARDPSLEIFTKELYKNL
jgi:UDP-N-acetylmuramate--alanine ligase